MNSKPVVEHAAKRGIVGRQHKWCTVERLRKLPAVVLGFDLRGEDGNRALAQQVAECAYALIRSDRGVGQHQIDLVDGEFCQESGRLPLIAKQVDRLLADEQRLKDMRNGHLREDIGDSHTQTRSTAGWTAVQGLQHLVTDREDIIGVALNDSSGFGEFQAATDSPKKPMARSCSNCRS